jgi:hypothetical protein
LAQAGQPAKSIRPSEKKCLRETIGHRSAGNFLLAGHAERLNGNEKPDA